MLEILARWTRKIFPLSASLTVFKIKRTVWLSCFCFVPVWFITLSDASFQWTDRFSHQEGINSMYHFYMLSHLWFFMHWTYSRLDYIPCVISSVKTIGSISHGTSWGPRSHYMISMLCHANSIRALWI